MKTSLFSEFDKSTAAAWKQKIQVELKGADYNNSLLWKTDENFLVKPFYTKEDKTNYNVKTSEKGFLICQTIFIDDEKIANSLALDALKRGATSIQFKANSTFDYKKVLHNIDLKKNTLYFLFTFLDPTFQIEVSEFTNSKNTYFQTDIIGNLAETGNWFNTLKEDFKKLHSIEKQTPNCIGVSGDLYQNCGATITQQLAYTLAHANEYLNEFGNGCANKINFIFSVGSNYFFEIAKLRAFRLLWSLLTDSFDEKEIEAHLFVQPSLRNKTIYDYNVNLLRTTSESMSAILGGANTISNISYDAIYHKSNEFGERISRNQLLILQKESFLNDAQNYADGSYYIDAITTQLAENALLLFKQIEKKGGFLAQLKAGIIQKKIKESSDKETADFLAGKLRLLGTNFQENLTDKMKQNIELYPFVKQRNIKTIITPLIKKRLSEVVEKERLKSED